VTEKDKTVDRMLAKVEFCDDGCWRWTGAHFSNGYAHAGSRRFGSILAHRFLYQYAVGDVPAGMDLDHLCRVRDCVNPDHLEPVTRSVNLRRGVNVGGDRRSHRRGSDGRYELSNKV
jgi:hypothetical protein